MWFIANIAAALLIGSPSLAGIENIPTPQLLAELETTTEYIRVPLAADSTMVVIAQELRISLYELSEINPDKKVVELLKAGSWIILPKSTQNQVLDSPRFLGDDIRASAPLASPTTSKNPEDIIGTVAKSRKTSSSDVLRWARNILNPIVKTSADLASEGKNCNFFARNPSVTEHYVLGEKHVFSDVMTTTSGYMTTAKEGGIYSQIDAPYYTTDCIESSVNLFCMKGSCIVSMDSGKYGYHPGERNTVLIDGQRFSWIGDMPNAIGRQMWSALRDGSVVKSSLSLWPSTYTNNKDVVQGVQELKNQTYQLSLGEVD